MAYVSRVLKGINLEPAEVDDNFVKSAEGVLLDAVIISASTTLTQALHSGRVIEVNSPTAITLTLSAQTAGGHQQSGQRYCGVNTGPGAITFVAPAGGAIVGDSTLPAAVTQYSFFILQRVSASNTYLRG